MELKTSESKREFKTGSVRDSATGKPRIDLIPSSTLIKLGIHYGNGAEHYGANNWKKGQPISSYMASFERHYNQFKAGITDENHLISAIWNLIAIDWTLDAVKTGILPAELDDREPDQKENGPMANFIQKTIKENIDKAKEKKELTYSQNRFTGFNDCVYEGFYDCVYENSIFIVKDYIFCGHYDKYFFRAIKFNNDPFSKKIISDRVKGECIPAFIGNRINEIKEENSGIIFSAIDLSKTQDVNNTNVFYVFINKYSKLLKTGTNTFKAEELYEFLRKGYIENTVDKDYKILYAIITGG